MSKKSNLLRPFLYISIGCCIAMTAASYFFNMRLFYLFSAITLICIILLLWQSRLLKKSINVFLLRMGDTLTKAQQESMTHFPIPVFVCEPSGSVLWYNRLSQQTVLGGESGYSERIQNIVGDVELQKPCPAGGYEVHYKERYYNVYISAVADETNENETLYVAYFFEITRLKLFTLEYFETRPAILLIVVDNYEELQQNLKDSERTRVMGQIEYEVGKYITEAGGLLLKAERDRFTAVIEERGLRSIMASRFVILERIRSLENADRQIATLSIGVGHDAKTYEESEQFARQALDMALGRGGDQAAVRGASGYEFFGGVSNGVEKRTKVKTRIVASALLELINGSDNVFVMGHRNADLDAFGSSFGMMRAARMLGKDAYVVINREQNLVGDLIARLDKAGFSGEILTPEAAEMLIMKKSLLIVCDTHIETILDSKAIFDACRSIVVIDHHRKMVGHIENAVIFYHEPYASSASEMVTELYQYFGNKVRAGRAEAEALLAGIMLDTKNFVLKTGVRTFEAAAYLRKAGADTVEVRRLFASSMEAYQRKTKLVANAQVYRNCAIAVSSEKDAPDIQVTAAQAADELLNIRGVQASFLVFAAGNGISYSARSMGQLNVQLIMEKLGGGGHHTMAGAQIANIDLKEAYDRLIKAIDQFFEENTRK